MNNPLADLVGKFFHTTKQCDHNRTTAEWQGRITGTPTAGLLLIELFEWTLGEPNGEQFITLDDFVAKKPVLYGNADEMRFSFDHGALSHSARCEPSRDPAVLGSDA